MYMYHLLIFPAFNRLLNHLYQLYFSIYFSNVEFHSCSLGIGSHDAYRDSDRERHKERTPSPHRSRSKRKTKSHSHKRATFSGDEPGSPPMRTALAFSSDDDLADNGEDLTRPKTVMPPPPPILENTEDWKTGVLNDVIF